MNTFALVFFCVQACLVQNVFSQCAASALRYDGLAPAAAFGPAAFGPAAFAPAAIAPAAFAPEAFAPAYAGAYGGAGIGDVAVAGELPVAGTTFVAGQVPIIGSVRFAGDLPAAGTVSIAGSCGCGCGAHYY